MRLCLDTNVLLATIIDAENTADIATELLDSDEHSFVVTALSIMELRAVLTKKEKLEPETVEDIIADIGQDVDVFIPDSGDIMTGVRLQKETLLYPMDAMILACADAADASLVSFDGELQQHGAVAPSDVL
jgi:predicted nucleic acid-binding protein